MLDEAHSLPKIDTVAVYECFGLNDGLIVSVRLDLKRRDCTPIQIDQDGAIPKFTSLMFGSVREQRGGSQIYEVTTWRTVEHPT